MELRRFDDAAIFYNPTRGFLLAHEAEHNLILGICERLVANTAHYGSAPSLAAVHAEGAVVAVAVMTPPWNLVLSLSPPQALPLIAADLHTQHPTLPGVIGMGAVGRAFAEDWRRISGQVSRLRMATRIYQLMAVRPVSGVPGVFRRATVAERDLLVTWIWGVNAETPAAREIDDRLRDADRALYVWEVDGHPVSMAGQEGPTPHGIRINSVCTPLEYRRRGYASACVAALSQHLLDSGYRFCFLSTDLSNPTSNRIYQAIGYTPVCDVDDYAFLPPERDLAQRAPA